MNSETASKTRTAELTKRFLITLLPMLLIIAAMSLVIFRIETDGNTSKIKNREKSFIKQYKHNISDELHIVNSDLMTLSEIQDLQKLVDGNPLNKGNLEKTFLIFVKNRGLYDQIRFLDNTGMEIVRINYNNGNPSVVLESSLQSKGNRYYFSATYGLDRGEVYISPFDLNKEQGKIEQPLKPMIRLGTPVFDSSGIKKGIVILNYLGVKMLHEIDLIAANNAGKPMLLNSDGYWLKSPNSKNEWGFMYEHKRNRTFGKAYPAAWEQITSVKAGQFLDSTGLHTYETIYPLSKIRHSSTGSHEAVDAAKTGHNSQEYYWKIVSFTPQSILAAGKFKFFTRIIVIDGILSLILAASSLLYSQSYVDRKQAEIKRRESEEKFRVISTYAQDAILMMDANGSISFWNDAAVRIFGWSEEDALGKNLHSLIVPEKYHSAQKNAFEHFRRTGEGAAIGKTLELSGKRRDGTEFPVELSLAEVHIKDEWHSIGIMRDISERKQAETALSDSRERYIKAERIGNFGHWERDLIHDRGIWSDGAFEIFGVSRDSFSPSFANFLKLIHADDREHVQKELYKTLSQSCPLDTDYRIVCPDGNERIIHSMANLVMDEAGQPEKIVGIVQDITERKKMEQQLQNAAITDALTGLLNRRGFFTLAEQHCKLATRSKRKMSLMYIDLNHFKTINDTLGHKTGDQALIDTANILKNSFRNSDIVTRLGGDEFAVLLTDTTGPQCEKEVMDQMHDILSKYNTRGHRNYTLSFSTGMAHYDPEHPCSVEALLTTADTLMYNDKKHYRNQFTK